MYSLILDTIVDRMVRVAGNRTCNWTTAIVNGYVGKLLYQFPSIHSIVLKILESFLKPKGYNIETFSALYEWLKAKNTFRMYGSDDDNVIFSNEIKKATAQCIALTNIHDNFYHYLQALPDSSSSSSGDKSNEMTPAPSVSKKRKAKPRSFVDTTTAFDSSDVAETDKTDS
jgi:hypothetical protein